MDSESQAFVIPTAPSQGLPLEKSPRRRMTNQCSSFIAEITVGPTKHERDESAVPPPLGYARTKILGHGSTALVELCTHLEDQAQFAVKSFLHKPLTRRNAQRQKEMHEIEVMRSLPRHPNIVQFVDAFIGKCTHIVMEYVSGGVALGGRVEEDPLDTHKAIAYFNDCLAALEVIHEQNVIHLDLKPQNMVITGEGRLKVIDFGSAKRLSHPTELITGAVGTPMFWAPECARQGLAACDAPGTGGLHHPPPYSGQPVDIWALGATMHQFLTGKVPFRAPDVDELRRKILDTELILPSTIPSHLHTLLQGMLTKDPESRWTILRIKEHFSSEKPSTPLTSLNHKGFESRRISRFCKTPMKRRIVDRYTIDCSPPQMSLEIRPKKSTAGVGSTAFIPDAIESSIPNTDLEWLPSSINLSRQTTWDSCVTASDSLSPPWSLRGSVHSTTTMSPDLSRRCSADDEAKNMDIDNSNVNITFTSAVDGPSGQILTKGTRHGQFSHWLTGQFTLPSFVPSPQRLADAFLDAI